MYTVEFQHDYVNKLAYYVDDWTNTISLFTLKNNNGINVQTKYTPHELVFGIKNYAGIDRTLEFDSEDITLNEIKNCDDYDKYIELLKCNKYFNNIQANMNIESYNVKRCKQFTHNKHYPAYHEGQEVMVSIKAVYGEIGNNKKITLNNKCNYIIIKIENNNARVRNIFTNEEHEVHVSRLIPYERNTIIDSEIKNFINNEKYEENYNELINLDDSDDLLGIMNQCELYSNQLEMNKTEFIKDKFDEMDINENEIEIEKDDLSSDESESVNYKTKLRKRMANHKKMYLLRNNLTYDEYQKLMMNQDTDLSD